MQHDVFYLHEDEWAMIDLLPAENFTDLLRIAGEAQAFGDEHFDGFGWTDMYVIPQQTYPLALRTLPLDELQNLLQEHFIPASIVQSGYSSYRETCQGCFAFVEAGQADGALYGEQRSGLVTGLHLLPYEDTSRDRRTYFSEILHTLGATYDLVLVDWWTNALIDLRERSKVVGYLEAFAHQE